MKLIPPPDPNLPTPVFLAQLKARDAAREKRKQEELAKLSIDFGNPQSPAQQRADMIAGKGRWKLLGQAELERKAAEEAARLAGEELLICEEPEF